MYSVNAITLEDKAASVSNELTYLEPIVKIHQLSKIKSKHKPYKIIVSDLFL